MSSILHFHRLDGFLRTDSLVSPSNDGGLLRGHRVDPLQAGRTPISHQDKREMPAIMRTGVLRSLRQACD